MAFSAPRSTAAALAAMVLALAPAAHAQDGIEWHRHTLYIDANITSGNAILAYDIHSDGSLSALPGSPFATGGTGFYDPSFVLGPFDVDQEMATHGDVLYAVNAGSNSISALRMDFDGALDRLPGQPFASGGSTPVSLGVHRGALVALNSAQDPAQAGQGKTPNLSVSAISANGALKLVPGDGAALPAGVQPSQVVTTNTGPFVLTAEFPASGRLNAYYQDPDGGLTLTDSELLPPEPNNIQPLPLGLWANPRAPYLYVGFVNTSEVGVYTVDHAGKLRFIAKVANSGVAICWLRVSSDGKFLYTVNTGDASMSVYDLSTPAMPVEIQHLVIGGVGGLQQFSLTPGGKYLYVLQEETSAASVGLSNVVYGLKVDKTTGRLALLSTTKLPLPANTRPFGVTIR